MFPSMFGKEEEIEYANSLGIETIITDHHEAQETIPNALAVVDNKRNNLYIEEFVISSVEKNEDNTFFITCEITGELYPEDYSNSISYYAFILMKITKL